MVRSLGISWVAFAFACVSASQGESQATPPQAATSAAPATEEPATEEPAAGEPPQTEASAEEPPTKEALDEGSEQDWLRVGEATDGVTVTAADVVDGPAAKGATLVLSFDGDGPVPATRARLENPRLVVVVVEGIRHVHADLPVVTGEGFRVVGTPRPIGRGPVKSIGRGFYGDDSGIRIDVELRELAGLELIEGTKGRKVELRFGPVAD